MKIRFIVMIPITLLLFAGYGCSSEPKDPETREVKMADLGLKSDAFNQGDMIPGKYTCDGEDISPAFTWSAPPEGTKELVLICDDPDAPYRTWDHWILFGISPEKTGLAEGAATSVEKDSLGTHGKNSWGKSAYGGPCPPKGTTHRYFFKLYAVDKKLDLNPGTKKEEILKAMEGHILAEGELMGKYAR